VEFIVLAGHGVRRFDPMGAIFMPPFVAICLLILIMDLHAAGEYGMWQGLICRKSTKALMKTMLYVIILPAVSCCSWPFVAVVKNLIFINFARDQMRRRFRAVVAERYTAAPQASDSLFGLPRRDRNRLPPVMQR
jgi:hypothetical protein